MPATGPGLSTALVVMLVGGAAAGAATIDASEGLEEELKVLMDNTLRDLDVGWLDGVAAYGNHTSAGYDRVAILVRADGASGAVQVDQLVALDGQGGTLDLAVDPVRDPDGSLSDGELGADDLARLTITLTEPATGDHLALMIHHPDKAPLHLDLGLPEHPSDQHVQLQILRDW